MSASVHKFSDFSHKFLSIHPSHRLFLVAFFWAVDQRRRGVQLDHLLLSEPSISSLLAHILYSKRIQPGRNDICNVVHAL